MITIDTNYIALINAAVIILYVICYIRGAKRGVFLQILSSLGVVVSFLGAWRYCSLASSYYSLWPKNFVPMADIPFIGDQLYTHLNMILWFILLFFIFKLVFMIVEKLCEGLSDLPVIREVSGFLGGCLGLVSATVWIMVFCVILNLPLFRNGSSIAESSLIGKITDTASAYISEAAEPIAQSEMMGKAMEALNNFQDMDEDMITEWLSNHGIRPNQGDLG